MRARRRNEFRRQDSERIVAVAITDWVLLNARGVPIRAPADVVNEFPVPAGDFTPLRIELPAPASVAAVTGIDFAPRLSELDPLGHVNNAAYLDYVDEHLTAIGRRSDARRRPRRYQGEFLASAEAQMTLCGAGWDADGSWCYRLSADGRELFRGRFYGAAGSWVGS